MRITFQVLLTTCIPNWMLSNCSDVSFRKFPTFPSTFLRRIDGSTVGPFRSVARPDHSQLKARRISHSESNRRQKKKKKMKNKSKSQKKLRRRKQHKKKRKKKKAKPLRWERKFVVRLGMSFRLFTFWAKESRSSSGNNSRVNRWNRSWPINNSFLPAQRCKPAPLLSPFCYSVIRVVIRFNAPTTARSGEQQPS